MARKKAVSATEARAARDLRRMSNATRAVGYKAAYKANNAFGKVNKAIGIVRAGMRKTTKSPKGKAGGKMAGSGG